MIETKTFIWDGKNAVPLDVTNVIIRDGVKEIGDSAFLFRENLSNIVIPSSVDKIGKCAFFGCKNLQCLVIPDSVKNIGEGAFYGCDTVIYNYYLSAGEDDKAAKEITIGLCAKGLIDNVVELIGRYTATNNPLYKQTLEVIAPNLHLDAEDLKKQYKLTVEAVRKYGFPKSKPARKKQS